MSQMCTGKVVLPSKGFTALLRPTSHEPLIPRMIRNVRSTKRSTSCLYVSRCLKVIVTFLFSFLLTPVNGNLQSNYNHCQYRCTSGLDICPKLRHRWKERRSRNSRFRFPFLCLSQHEQKYRSNRSRISARLSTCLSASSRYTYSSRPSAY